MNKCFFFYIQPKSCTYAVNVFWPYVWIQYFPYQCRKRCVPKLDQSKKKTPICWFLHFEMTKKCWQIKKTLLAGVIHILEMTINNFVNRSRNLSNDYRDFEIIIQVQVIKFKRSIVIVHSVFNSIGKSFLLYVLDHFPTKRALRVCQKLK